MAEPIPATPAGDKLRACLDHFNTGDPATFRTLITEHFQEEPTDRAISLYSVLFQDSKGLEVVRAEQSEEHSITMLARPRGFDGWGHLTVVVEPQPPHRVTRFGFFLRPCPADQKAPHQLPETEIVTKLEDHLTNLAEQDLFSGSVLVARNNLVLFQGAYGWASRAYSAPNKVDTRFNLGSMNKMFTAVAIAQLVQAGRVALTDTVGKFLPTWPQPAASTVTVHHLLTHTSGMGAFWNQQFEERKVRLRTVPDFLTLFQNDPLAFEPGARFAYSNNGFVVLGTIIEQVTGQSYFDYVREHIYQPAGMTDTDCYDVDDDVPNLATGYTRTSALGTVHADRRFSNILQHVAKGGPAGGGFSTAPDLLRFATAMQEHRLLDAAHTELVLTGKVDAFPGTKYGYGFIDDRSNGTRVVGHSGGFPGINSSLDMYVDLGYTVIVMSNYDPPTAAHVSLKVLELITQG